MTIEAGFMWFTIAVMVYLWLRNRIDNPFELLYHETGIASQRGIVYAVHHERKRFSTLREGVDAATVLLNKGYCVILLSEGDHNSVMFEKPWKGNHYKMYCEGAFRDLGQEFLALRIPGHTIAWAARS